MTADLNTLLDSLNHGEHVKATWTRGKYLTTYEGPVHVNGMCCSCEWVIRWADGAVDGTLASIEVTRDEEVTATRDDGDELHALLDSLTDGQEVTAEWRDENGVMILTGLVLASKSIWMHGLVSFPLRNYDDDNMDPALHSVTIRRSVVKRWERDGDE